MKSHFCLARSLHELKWDKECLNQFCKLYTDYSNTSACELLADEIEKSSSDEKRKNFEDKNGDKSNKQSLMKVRMTMMIILKNQIVKNMKIFLKQTSIDYSSYFSGHCNVSTDIS
jgi:hypothetical protein